MGHANLSNLSRFFVKRLYARGKLSIREASEAASQAGEQLCASEGAYDDLPMLAMGIGDVVSFLLSPHAEESPSLHSSKRPPKSPVIEAVDPTDEQMDALERWQEHGEDEEPDDSGFYPIMDNIQFKFAKGWRRRYPEIPLLGNVTH